MNFDEVMKVTPLKVANTIWLGMAFYVHILAGEPLDMRQIMVATLLIGAVLQVAAWAFLHKKVTLLPVDIIATAISLVLLGLTLWGPNP